MVRRACSQSEERDTERQEIGESRLPEKWAEARPNLRLVTVPLRLP